MIQSSFPEARLTLIPGGRGDFLVKADGAEIWNKRQSGRFPEPAEILEKLA
jgi:selT/selW/selH-like putative selenoprotein